MTDYQCHSNGCDARTLLKERGLRVTEKRIAILKWILDNDGCFHAAQLFGSVSVSTSIDLATVYRQLSILVDYELIREVIEADGLTWYESACIHHPDHSHFICERCRNIICLRSLNQPEKQMLGQIGGNNKIETINLFLKGCCHDCQRENP